MDELNQKQAEGSTKNAKKKQWKLVPTSRYMPMAYFGILALLFLGIAIWCIVPPRQRLEEGETASRTISAPFDKLDIAATEQAKKDAATQVEPVYYHDSDAFERVQRYADEYINSITRMKVYAEELRDQIIQASDRDSDLRRYAKGNLTSAEWRRVLEGEGINSIQLAYSFGFSDMQIFELLALPDVQLNIWLRESYVLLNNTLRRGIKEGEEESLRSNFISKMSTSTPLSIRSINNTVAGELIVPTMFYDAAATERAIGIAQRNINPKYFAKGEVLIKKGDVVDKRAVNLLESAGFYQSPSEIIVKYIIIIAFITLLFTCVMVYFPMLLPGVIRSPQKCIITVAATIINLIITCITISFNPYANLSFLGGMMLTQLVSLPMAIAMTLLTAPIIGIVTGGQLVFEFGAIVQCMLGCALGGLMGIFIMRKANKRTQMLLSGLVAGISMAIVMLLFNTLQGMPWLGIMQGAFTLILSGLVSAMIGVALLPIFESVFDVATPARLMELGNASHPLLQRMMLEAPGTYHHSMMVAALSESAATAIGANVPLARAGAYFHDIGKLKRPLYFKENQRAGENPHDQLDAITSATIIITHVKDGLLMAQKHKLPGDICAIIAQHHGNTAVGMMYYKAVAQSGNPNLSMDGFRYAGPKPLTKESAIVMLCDSVEAAVRSLEIQNYENVSEMVKKIVKGKIDDGQLSNAPLSLSDIDAIVKAMLKSFNGILHERIEYPDLNKLKEELNDRN